jgi:heme/copper-type cytochrome/quinol oxidase subunit 2
MYGSDGTATSTSTTDDFAVDSRMADQDQAGTITTSATSDLTLYIVFGVALLVFALVIIVIVKILKKKNPNPNGYTLTSTGKTIFSFLWKTFSGEQ